jgi:hypothetical protein
MVTSEKLAVATTKDSGALVSGAPSGGSDSCRARSSHDILRLQLRDDDDISRLELKPRS